MSAIDEVKARVDIVDLIGQATQLKRSGKSYRGLCPFHAERTPSFFVYPDDWSYHCFGCGAHGNGFDFVMATQKLDFGEALRTLAARAGVVLPSQRERSVEDTRNDRLRELLGTATQYFHHLLRVTPTGAPARTYLEQRGLTRDTMEVFQLGYSPESWDATSTYLRSRGYSTEDLLEAGLLVERDSGGTYDRFRNRLMFPIHDRDGGVIGFGARALDDSKPKYLNSPQTPLFDKSSTLYGFAQARQAIRSADVVIIVEGYVDVLMAHQHNFKHVVGTLGTALSPKHVTTLKRLTKNVILALDPDTAGDEAMLRGIQVAEAVFDRRFAPAQTPSGIKMEATVDANLRVMALPRGKDPDEVIQSDPDLFRRLTTEALPVVDFWFTAVSADLDRTRPEHRDEARRKLLPVIRRLSDRVQQAYYIQRLAQLLGVNESILWQELRRLRPDIGAAPAGEAVAGSVVQRAVDPLEAHCLSLLLTRPELRVQIGEIAEDDFDDALHRQILLLLRENASDEQIRDRLPPDLHPALEQLIKPTLQRDPLEIAQADWNKAIRRLRRNRLLRQHQAQEILRQEAIAQDQLGDAEYWSAQLVETATQLAQLDRELVTRRRR